MTEREYNECVNQYADNVYRFILKNLRHEEDARDVVQGTFEKMWVNRLQVDNAKCKSYLFTVAYHQMIDHIRKNKRSLRVQGDLTDQRIYPSDHGAPASACLWRIRRRTPGTTGRRLFGRSLCLGHPLALQRVGRC